MSLSAAIPAALALQVVMLGSAIFLMRPPRRGVKLLLAVFVADTLWGELPALPLGLHIYAQDIALVLLLGAAALRYLLGMARLDRSRVAVLTLLALVVFSIGRGIAANGVTAAGVESRGFFWLFAGMAYFSSFEYGETRIAEMVRLWQKAACALILIAVFRWIATGLQLGIAASWAVPGAPAMRVLNSAEAMFLCVALFFSLALKASRRGRKWQQNLYYAIGPALILLQHRTVWVITAVGMVWMFRRQARLLRRSLLPIAAALGAGAVLVVSLFGIGFVAESLQQSATSSNSFIWRASGWYQLVFLRNADAAHLLFGDPFGTGFERLIANVRVDFTPHDFYIETYLRLGIAGLCILLWFFQSRLQACRKLASQPAIAGAYVNPRLWELLLVFQMIYSLTYNPGYEQSVILGMIVGLNSLRDPAGARARHSIQPERLLLEPS